MVYLNMTRASEIGLSLLFGFIAFIVCIFLFSVWTSLLIGGLTFALFMLALCILFDRENKKYTNIHEQIGENILIMENANFYEAKLLCSGFLFLTETKLVFISREKKNELRRDIRYTYK